MTTETLTDLLWRSAVPIGVLLLIGRSAAARRLGFLEQCWRLTAVFLVLLLPLAAFDWRYELRVLPANASIAIPEFPGILLPHQPASDAAAMPTVSSRAAIPTGAPVRTLAWVYLFGVFAVLARRLRGEWLVQQVVRRAVPVRAGSVLGLAVHSASGRLNISGIDVRLSTDATSPFVTGVFHSTVVLPIRALQWSASQQDSVLLHEVAHIQRADLRWHALWDLLRAAYWFHPLVWVARHEVRRLSELGCDGVVVLQGHPADAYAGDLMAVARQGVGHPRLRAATGLGRAMGLEERVVAVLEHHVEPTPRSPLRNWWFALGVLCISTVMPVSRPAAQPDDVRRTMNLSTGGRDISANGAGLQARWVVGGLHRGLFVTNDPGFASLRTGTVVPGASLLRIVESATGPAVHEMRPGDATVLEADVRAQLLSVTDGFAARDNRGTSVAEAPTPRPPRGSRPGLRSSQLGLPAISRDPGLGVVQGGWVQDGKRYALMMRGQWHVRNERVSTREQNAWLVLQVVDIAAGESRVVLLGQDRRLLGTAGNSRPLDPGVEGWVRAVFEAFEGMRRLVE